VASPFIVVHELLVGSDSGAVEAAAKQARRLLDAHPGGIPAEGLYTGSLDMRMALYGLLVDARLPFVEINVAGSAWLMSLASDAPALVARAEGRPYIRLSLAERGAPACVAWTYPVEKWLASPPVRPGTCLALTFEDHLRSDLQLAVDARQVSARKLRWQLSDRASGAEHLAIPFWQSQTAGQPLRAAGVYREESDAGNDFARLIQKASPTAFARRADGQPFVMNRVRSPVMGESDLVDRSAVVRGEFRVPRTPPALLHQDNESWSDGYAQAIRGGKPRVINNGLLVVPETDSVARACAFPFPTDCSFESNFAADVGVLSVLHRASYQPPPSVKYPAAHGMALVIAGRAYDGRLLWYFQSEPEPGSVPAAAQPCREPASQCDFHPVQAAVTDGELIVYGRFASGNAAVRELLPRDVFEWAIPVASLTPARPMPARPSAVR